MKNKGFTLIELLAVIVILAIIALIATPIILNIIDNTKEESVKRSIDHYMSAATTAIAAANLNNTANGVKPEICSINSNGNLKCGDYPEIPVDIDGEKPTGGTITFENGKITGFTDINIDGNTYELDEKGNIVLVGSGEGSVPGTGEGEAGTLYTGVIYKNSTDVLDVGDSINTNNRWCVVTQESASSCVYDEIYSEDDEEGINKVFNSEEECETALEELFEDYPELLVNASCEQGTLSYETNEPNINAYLKYDVVEDEVIASYACIMYVENGIRNDVCLRGADRTYYTQNLETLHGLESYFNTLDYNNNTNNYKGYCSFDETSSHCYSDSLDLFASYYGNVSVTNGSSVCSVYSDGTSGCSG